MASDKPLFAKGSLISIPHVRFAITGKFNAPRGPGEIGTGKSYIPPCTLNMFNPSPHKQVSHKGLFQAAQSLPASFSWNNNSDIVKYKGADMKNIIMKPLNQLKCGSCWAFAVSTALSDRVGIAQGKNPNLGPSYLLACSVTGNCDKDQLAGCNGGVISTALQDMVNPIGGVLGDCWNYKWCDSCSGDGDSDNKLIPSFPQNDQKCVSNTSLSPLLYKVQDGTIKTIPSLITQPDGTNKVDYTAIKESLFNHGPLPTGYIVFQDFFMGTAPKDQGGDNWAATNGIYVHLDTDTTGYTPDGDASPYKYGSSTDMTTEAGAHAVVIIGWGTAEIPNPVPKAWARLNGGKAPATIQMPYWVVRNSWGTGWCEGGFFRIAQTNPDLHIGGTVMFDQSGAQSVGGVVEFTPDLSTAPAPSSLKESGSSSSSSWIWIVGLLIIALAVGVFFFRKRR